VAQLADGSLAMRVPEASQGELGTLERGVNRMAAALEENQRDLEQRIQTATRELMAQKEAAEAAVLVKSRFLAATSHDLRQPLHALTLLIAALRERIQEDEARRLVEHIDASASALEGLLNALLDLSKLDAGVVAAHTECFPAQRTLDNLSRQFTPQARQKGLRLRIHGSTCWLHSDPILLERILNNLVSNALCYTDRGAVLVGLRRASGGVRFEVRDSGRGIPEAFHARIFEEYFQLENPERHRDKGLGLGLAIVARLARLLGSGVAMKSTAEHGSCFSFQVARCQPPEHPVATEGTAFALPLAGTLVAFIDDDAQILEAMMQVFEQWGVEMAGGSEVEAVRDELRELGRAPDIILSDYRLRGGRSGIDAVRLLREAFGEAIPAALITGDTAPETIQAIAACGLALLHKPLKPAKLRAFLSHLRRGGQAPLPRK
jgi:signal transduction histidine kinase